MSYTLRIYQDKELVKEFFKSENGGEAFGWLLRNQHLSVDSALRWGGWAVEQINEQTEEKEFWKPYDRIEWEGKRVGHMINE